MKIAVAATAALLQAGLLELALAQNLEAGSVPRIYPRKEEGSDCGKWHFNCKGAESACNNACYHVKCVDQKSETMVYDSKNNEQKHRENSGCQTTGGSVCDAFPFSQKLHDPFRSSEESKGKDYSCDEWPMAMIKQDDFKDGKYRNSLRCIPTEENDNAGRQLQEFIAGKDGMRDRTCKGKLKDGDRFKVTFETKDADQDKMPFCVKKTCDNDGYEFRMTKKTARKGDLRFPYDAGRDNHYTVAGLDRDILQCSVVIHRRRNAQFDIELFDWMKKSVKKETQHIEDPNGFVIAKGLPADLAIIKTGSIGTRLSFNYGAHEFFKFDAGKGDFAWDTDSVGQSRQFRKNRDETDDEKDAMYCRVGNVDRMHKPEQRIECFFPCYAKQ
ncbi:MAG: hypothetical protein M1833_006849 [Piccolia ochrophora]|nr:MAG: hypothetical protein M1833_006849 [Piccolia ochrophora]